MAKRARTCKNSGKNADCGIAGDPFTDLNLTNLCLKIRDEAEAIAICEEMGLLPSQAGPHGACVCGYRQLSSTKDASEKLGWRYYCCGCKKKYNAIKNTWFQDSNISILSQLKMILCFVSGCTYKQVVKFCDVSTSTAVQ